MSIESTDICWLGVLHGIDVPKAGRGMSDAMNAGTGVVACQGIR
jgi:hypothetical protein